jgi:hypothetical protein
VDEGAGREKITAAPTLTGRLVDPDPVQLLRAVLVHGVPT